MIRQLAYAQPAGNSDRHACREGGRDAAVPEKRAILITYPQPSQDTCGLFMPFDESLNGLRNAITTAASRVGFATTVRADDSWSDPQWINRITTLLLTSKVIVCVFPNLPGKRFPNPNVMFEAGFARALGKAVLVMSDNAEALPSNLTPYDYFSYNSSETDSQSFRARLENRFYDLRDNTTKWNSSASECRVLQGAHVAFAECEFLDSFGNILDFSILVRDYMQHVYAYSLRPMVEAAKAPDQPADKQQEQASADNFRQHWYRYIEHFRLMCDPAIFSKLRTLKNVNDNYISILCSRTQTIGPLRDVESGKRLGEGYSQLVQGLEQFLAVHNELQAVSETVGLSRHQLVDRIDRLDQIAQLLLTRSSALTKVLTGIIHS